MRWDGNAGARWPPGTAGLDRGCSRALRRYAVSRHRDIVAVAGRATPHRGSSPRLRYVSRRPGPYGRFVLAPDGGLERIVEAAEADPEQQAIGLVNGGIMVIEACRLAEFLDALDSDNAKREFYLTDIVAIARRKGSPAERSSCRQRSSLGSTRAPSWPTPKR